MITEASILIVFGFGILIGWVQCLFVLSLTSRKIKSLSKDATVFKLWQHSCDGVSGVVVKLWIDRCPHCGCPRGEPSKTL